MDESSVNGVGSADAVPVSDDELLPSAEAADAILTLLSCRAQYLVGMALAIRYPTEEQLQDLLADRDFIDSVMAFAEIKTDMRHEAVVNGDTLDARATAVAHHQGRALEALSTLSEMLRVPVEDLISVLVRQ